MRINSSMMLQICKRILLAGLGTVAAAACYLIFARAKIVFNLHDTEYLFFSVYLIIEFLIILFLIPYYKRLSSYRVLFIGLLAGYLSILLADIVYNFMVPDNFDVFVDGYWWNGVMTLLWGALIRFYWTLSPSGFLLVALLLKINGARY